MEKEICKTKQGILNVLRHARNLIKNAKNWTQGMLATDNQNQETFPWSEQATCFCSMGAIQRASLDLALQQIEGDALCVLRETIEKETGCKSIAKFNDLVSHKNVIRMFDAAIEKVERK